MNTLEVMELSNKSIQDILISETDIFTSLSSIFADAIVLKTNYEISDASPSIFDFLNFPKNQLEKLPFSHLFATETEFDNFRNELEFKGYFTDFEANFKSFQGNLLKVSLSGYFLGMLSDNNGIVIHVKNIDEIKNLTETLYYKTAELEDFLYRSSHDLRGPLATIQGLVNICMLPQTSVEDQIKYLKEIKKFSDTLDQSLRNIQNISERDLLDTKHSNISNIDQLCNALERMFKHTRLQYDTKFSIQINHFNSKAYFPYAMILKFFQHLFNYLEHMGKTDTKRKIKIKISSQSKENIIKISTKGFELSDLHKEMLSAKYLSGAAVFKNKSVSSYYAAQKLASILSKQGIISSISNDEVQYQLLLLEK